MDTPHPDVIDISPTPDDTALWSLAYVTDREDAADLFRIHWALVDAWPTDAPAEVASLLVRWRDRFVHVLEGPYDKVLTAFDGFVLGSDPKRSVILADQGAIERRSIDPAAFLDIRDAGDEAQADHVEAAVLSILGSGTETGAPSAADRLLEALTPDTAGRLAA